MVTSISFRELWELKELYICKLMAHVGQCSHGNVMNLNESSSEKSSAEGRHDRNAIGSPKENKEWNVSSFARAQISLNSFLGHRGKLTEISFRKL